MITEAVRERLEDIRGWYIDQHLIEREAALDAFIQADQQRVKDGDTESDARHPGFTGGWAPYVGNAMGDPKKPFARVIGASRTLGRHVTRDVHEAFEALAKKAAMIEEKIRVDRCEAQATTSSGLGVLVKVEPQGGGHFLAHVSMRFQYGARTGVWRPMVIMTLYEGELPDGSRPLHLVGPRILKTFAELQGPTNKAGIDRMTINDL